MSTPSVSASRDHPGLLAAAQRQEARAAWPEESAVAVPAPAAAAVAQQARPAAA
ncbi:MAG: hypothetical protein GY719_00335 [bacterium]|nr:hypothetical protein [bacterium]